MATWPSTNKALTTTTDADTDTISGARVDINKSISNINDVIDMFNIPASPTDDYILKYDAATSRFELEEDSGGGLIFTNIQVDDLGAYMVDTLDYIDEDYFDDDNIEADSSTDTLYLDSGTGISFSQDVTTDTITITNTGVITETNDLTASVTWANVPDANITQSSVTQHQSALSITESQISDLGTYIGLTDISVTQESASGSGTLSYDNTTGVITYTPPDTSDLLANVVEDTTPQLGGNLDVNGNKITSTANGNIDIEPNGTGNVLLGNFTFDADQTVGATQDNYVLTYDHSAGNISLESSPTTNVRFYNGGTLNQDSGSFTPDFTDGNVIKYTGTAANTGNKTMNAPSNMSAGDSITFIIEVTAGTPGQDFDLLIDTSGTNIYFPSGASGGIGVTYGSAAVMDCVYDGSKYYFSVRDQAYGFGQIL